MLFPERKFFHFQWNVAGAWSSVRSKHKKQEMKIDRLDFRG